MRHLTSDLFFLRAKAKVDSFMKSEAVSSKEIKEAYTISSPLEEQAEAERDARETRT